MKKIELLAPAGSLETLKAVCAAGADAIYLGGSQFGARAYAKNFTQEELSYAIDYVHLHNKKIHLTVNTLLKNRELEEQLYDYLLPYYEQGLDAVIVQDAGVFSFIKKHFPGMELHASTQMTLTGADGAEFWKQAGADRVVLSRELSLEEIRQIHDRVDIELECFVHGALCYCYSGQCLFSSMLGGRSGNRGRCAQPCRLPYRVSEDRQPVQKGEWYPLSPKDLSGIDLLFDLVTAGVTSLKIEGRMKQTTYAAGVTSIYRKYLDMIETMDLSSDAKNYAVAKKDQEALMNLGNRSGFTDGYLRGEKGKEMITLQTPKHTSSQKDDTSLPEEKKRELSGVCTCKIGSPLTLTVTDPVTTITVTASAGEVQMAQNAPVKACDVEKIISQTGDTDFWFSSIEVELDDHCFIPKQFLKTVRRDALEMIRQELLRKEHRVGLAKEKEALPKTDAVLSIQKPDAEHLLVVCDTPEQFRVCMEKDYVSVMALALQSVRIKDLSSVVSKVASQCKISNKKLLLALPPVFRHETAYAYEKQWECIEKLHAEELVEGFLAKNYDSLGFLDRMGVAPAHIWLDSQLYTFSDRSADFFRGLGYQHHTLSLELNAKELCRLSQTDSILTIYGHTPFMVSSQCVNKTMYGCDQKEKKLFLTDRYEKQLPVKNYCSVCCNVIYNAMPTLLFTGRNWKDVEKIRPHMLRMDFTVESESQTREVLALYEKEVLGLSVQEHVFDGETTRGHFGRGVE